MQSMNPAWVFPVQSGLWCNTTAANASGSVLVGAEFKFDTTANFQVHVLSSNGGVILTDTWTNAWDGIFWVDTTADGSVVAAGGWQQGKPNYVGRLRAIAVPSGNSMVDQATSSRVNQVVLTPDGQWLVGGCNSSYGPAGQLIYLFKRNGQSYAACQGYSEAGLAIMSVALSNDGQWIVAATLGNNTALILFQNVNGALQLKARWTPSFMVPQGEPPQDDPRRVLEEYFESLGDRNGPKTTTPTYAKFVSMTPDGKRFAASMNRGGVALFDTQSFMTTKQPLWHYQLANSSIASCVSIAANGSFCIVLSNNSNYSSDSGWVYRVNDNNGAPALAWSTATKHCPNPSSHLMDTANHFISFGTGQPLQGSQLSPGCFYLVDVSGGAVLGSYDTSVMNWPFVLSGSGLVGVGGSDDGHIYGFGGQAI
jgi:hypothetical protein